MSNNESTKGEIVMYQPDETIRLEVRVESETVWLTQAQLVSLFQSSKANISEHIKNIYEQGELKKSATVRKFRTVQNTQRSNTQRSCPPVYFRHNLTIFYVLNNSDNTR